MRAHDNSGGSLLVVLFILLFSMVAAERLVKVIQRSLQLSQVRNEAFNEIKTAQQTLAESGQSPANAKRYPHLLINEKREGDFLFPQWSALAKIGGMHCLQWGNLSRIKPSTASHEMNCERFDSRLAVSEFVNGNLISNDSITVSLQPGEHLKLAVLGFINVKQLTVKLGDNSDLEIIAAGAISLFSLTIYGANKGSILLYSASGEIDVESLTGITAQALYLESRRKIVVEGKRLDIQPKIFGRDPQIWNKSSIIGGLQL
jgi:hypothetical protein